MLVSDALFVSGPLDSIEQGWAPAGATGQTMQRHWVRDQTSALVSGTAYGRKLMLPRGTVLNAVKFVNIGAETSGTHCWGGLADYAGNLLAVSSDNTGGTFLSGSGLVVSFTQSAFTTTYDGEHFAVFCASFGGTAPTMAALTLATGIAAIAPAFCGTFGGSFSTPPSTGTALGALSGNGAFNMYAWTT